VKAILIEAREIAPDVRHFVFEVPDVRDFYFVPGQFVSLTHNIDGREITRPYSIASKPGGNRFDLCLNLVEDGLFSPWLFSLEPGDEIETSAPLGFFVLRNPRQDALFVATGTGIAPIRSMLEAWLGQDDPRQLTLLYGVRYEYGLLYRDEFEELARKHPNFDFRPTLSRPEPTWRGRTGHVQAHLVEAVVERPDMDVYICGLKAMVDDVRALLKGMGFDRKQIVYEKYD
jgi:CDP-4-dehydro-6-deoxyglucose reductase